MRILVTGASGFIGRAIAHALQQRGHEVVRASRTAHGPSTLAVDFAGVPDTAWWTPRLQGIDAVVNAVGILRENGTQSFDALHARAPAELFRACAAAGVQRVVQVSALGANEAGTTGYQQSKKQADDALRALAVDALVVQPSLVYGPGGSSAALFNQMASLPVLALPRGGDMIVQPVHVNDIVDAIVAWLESPAAPGAQVETVAFTGPVPMRFADYLAQLRAALGWSQRAVVVPLPASLFVAGASVAGVLPSSFLDHDTATMLLQGNAAPADAFVRLLGREPRAVSTFVSAGDAPALRSQAVLGLWLPILRIALAVLWIATGIVSLGVYPVQDSLALLARVGLHGEVATVALYGAAALDLVLGVLTLVAPVCWRANVWLAQLLLIAGYTVLITLFLPEYWLHPYGPISKNLPLLALIGMLWTLETGKERAS